MLYYILHYTTCTTLHYTTLYYTILYYTILYTILYYTILYYTILYYTILYYTILYYTILYQPSRSLRSSSLKYLSVPKCIEYFLSRPLNSGTLCLITLDLLKTSALLKLALKIFFLRERLICISQMSYYSFHFSVIVFRLFQLIFFPCIF